MKPTLPCNNVCPVSKQGTELPKICNFRSEKALTALQVLFNGVALLTKRIVVGATTKTNPNYCKPLGL